jgi:Holliday junction resolvase RusA-like endonuclease
MSKQITETKRKSYPFIGFRPTKQQAARIRRVSRMLKRAKQPCGVSVVIRACVEPMPAGSKRAFAIRKGGVPTGRIAVVDACKESRSWKDAVANESAIAMRKESAHMLSDCPIFLTVKYYLPRPASHFGSGKNAAVVKASSPRFPISKPDVLKLTRAVEDAMTGIVWRDDSQVVCERIEKHYGSPVRAEITIETI